MSRTRYPTLFRMLKLQRTVLALAGVVATAGVWYFWPGNDGPELVTGPISVSYDREATRLTAIVNIQNSGDRPIVASITNDVFIDSQKQPLNDRRQPQPWRTELGSKQLNPVSFILQGDSAAAVWNGVRLMEVTIDAVYDGDAKLKCHFNFMGRFYPELKQIGTVSSVTSPRGCRGR
jgi:hypothetical protein